MLAFRLFRRQDSPRVIGVALLAALALRARQGRPRRRDLIPVLAVVASQGLIEWVLHRCVLHQPPRTIAGRTFDLSAGHRRHHEDPDDVGPILLGGREAAADCAAIAALMAAVTGPFPAHRRTAVAAGLGGLGAYEWTHFLMHTGYRPRTRWYAARRTNHRLHHYRNENYWMGITSNLGDRLLGTLPADKGDVELSATARTLS